MPGLVGADDLPAQLDVFAAVGSGGERGRVDELAGVGAVVGVPVVLFLHGLFPGVGERHCAPSSRPLPAAHPPAGGSGSAGVLATAPAMRVMTCATMRGMPSACRQMASPMVSRLVSPTMSASRSPNVRTSVCGIGSAHSGTSAAVASGVPSASSALTAPKAMRLLMARLVALVTAVAGRSWSILSAAFLNRSSVLEQAPSPSE